MSCVTHNHIYNTITYALEHPVHMQYICCIPALFVSFMFDIAVFRAHIHLNGSNFDCKWMLLLCIQCTTITDTNYFIISIILLYSHTYICGYSAQYIEFVTRSTLKLPEIKIIFSNSLTHSTFFIESIKNNKQRESCVYCVFCQNMRAFDNFYWLSLYKQWTPTWMISISSVCFRFFFVLISLFLLLLLLLSLFSFIVVLVHVVVIVVCEVSSCRDR